MAANRWTGKAGNGLWFDPRNWSSGVPQDQAPVRFADGGTWDISMAGTAEAIAGAATVLGDSLTFLDSRLTFDAAPARNGLTTDLAIGRGGSVTVAADAILVAEHAIAVGAVVAGALTAGSLTLDGAAWTGVLSLADGAMTIDGGSLTQWGGGLDVFAGGTMLIENGGTVGDGAASSDTMEIGGGAAPGIVTVTGQGSSLLVSRITAGLGYAGSLVVAAGAVVQTGILAAGSFGDGTVSVSGGAVLSAGSDIVIGGEVPVSSTLAVANHGSVYAGTAGLILEEGKLFLDPTAVLFGSIVSLGGYLIATPGPGGHPGTVVLGQSIGLGDLSADPGFGNVTWAESQGGAVLRVDGRITGDSTDVLRIASGTVEVTNTANAYGSTVLGNATLEVAATGAAGGGTLGFLQGDTGADLVTRGPFQNTIAGFAAGDTVDLAGFAFGAGVALGYAGGALTLNDGAHRATLTFAGQYARSDFAASADAHGGTWVTFHGG